MDGLVVHVQGVTVVDGGQFGEEFEAVVVIAAGLVRGLVGVDLGCAGIVGVVQSAAGTAQKVVERVAGPGIGDPDARPQADPGAHRSGPDPAASQRVA
ncbi:hypothetical protein BS329_41305 [Amycolatopsis coloradensis]|uniref:Uncharacterized protein n=1 Tax=Amycolatopsis coloradensis TaxID=76021 RepID=A0A1R0KD79_9PSEU|nr:hypothetical protein [Amycolatopsis coloradensis]OLZ42848.1 hypothetical protein BS329_41305 [Amycolatopsis coloradensis]